MIIMDNVEAQMYECFPQLEWIFKINIKFQLFYLACF